jgi:uncharacterized protein
MHITLHLTTACNLNCRYCYSPPPAGGFDMTREIIDKSIEFASREFEPDTGIIFFGGEPLLRKDLIKYAMGKCRTIEQNKAYKSHFHFKVTTNGLLMDEDFLNFGLENGLNFGVSIDGLPKAHDLNRIARNGQGSFGMLDKNIDNLLRLQPYANALMVVSPENVNYYAQSVEYLINRGFKYIIASLNYAGTWQEKHVTELKKQYIKLSRLYKKWTAEQRKFYFSPFEMKFATHIRGNLDKCYSCQLSKRQISIGPDGLIYPCVQFVKDGVSNREYSIGDIWNGFSPHREDLFKQSIEEKTGCKNCALNDRCYNTCSCLNWQTTGSITTVSPLLCETEKLLISIVDKLGEDLFNSRSSMFIQKHYNIAYPLLSMLEDELKK